MKRLLADLQLNFIDRLRSVPKAPSQTNKMRTSRDLGALRLVKKVALRCCPWRIAAFIHFLRALPLSQKKLVNVKILKKGTISGLVDWWITGKTSNKLTLN